MADKDDGSESLLPDPEELSIRLERLGGSLVELTRKGPGKKLTTPIMLCVQELRDIWSALRKVALNFNPNRADLMLQQEQELRQAMEILNGTVSTLSHSNDRTVATMDAQIGQLDGLDAMDDASMLADQLRSVSGNVRSAAAEMRDDVQRSAKELDASEQIIRAVDQKLNEARKQVLEDSLTRVLSRLAFEQRVQELAAQSPAVTGPWCVAIIGLDKLIDVNERNGRRVGDALLFRVAGVIQSTCESAPGSMVGRYGGGEFAILLPRSTLRQGKQFAEEIRTAVGGAKWECKTLNPPTVVFTTVSIGVTEYHKDETASELIDRAEGCLDRAKHGGRDRVVAEG